MRRHPSVERSTCLIYPNRIEIAREERPARGIRFSIANEHGGEVARAYLYVMTNDLHLDGAS